MHLMLSSETKWLPNATKWLPNASSLVYPGRYLKFDAGFFSAAITAAEKQAASAMATEN